MPDSILLSNTRQLDDHHIQLEDIGKSTGFLGLGRKVYLVYDEKADAWGVKSLNVIQRILRRIFGFYQETHSSELQRQLVMHPFSQDEIIRNETFMARVMEIWNFSLPKESDIMPSPAPILKQPSTLFYDSVDHVFKNRDSEVDHSAKQFQMVLAPASLKNIQSACLFGDWKEMGFNIDNEYVKKGKELILLEKVATEMPELGNAMFLNVRGNGECGYRTIVNGLIHRDCIQQNNIDGLKEAFQQAFNLLIESWNTLPFDPIHPSESKFFEISTNQALTQLDRMKTLSTVDRMALLQEEDPFLAPFLSLIRCITVSQTKLIERENDTLSKQTLAHVKRIHEILTQLKDQASYTEVEEKNLSYALQNYSLEALLSEDKLNDIIGNASQNLMKEQLQALVQRAHLAAPTLLTELIDLMSQEHELSNKQNILAASSAEMLEIELTLDEFLKQKALGDANSPRSLWAIGSDFTAIGYALNKNICCIYKDQYNENAFGIQKTYHNQAATFYGLNMTGQAHYNVLLPLC